LITLDPSVESAGALDACAVVFPPFLGSATAEEEDEEDEAAEDFVGLARAGNAVASLSSTPASRSSESPSGEVGFDESDGDAFSGLDSLLEDCFCLFEFSLPTEDNRKVLEARNKNNLNELIYLPWASSPGVLGSTN
jgi:hypothetical protein